MAYRVCLVFPPHMRDDVHYVTPPLGLLSIGAALEQAELDVSIVDFVFMLRKGTLAGDGQVYENAVTCILNQNPDAVAFYTQCVTYPTCVNMAKMLKERRPEMTVVFGGHNSSFLDIETLQEFGSVDCVCRGEGEISAVNLFSALRDGSDLGRVRGITYRTGNSEIVRTEDEDLIADLDTLPMPALHLVPNLQEYRALGQTLTVLIESGRGCSYNCIFCSNCRLWKRKVRHKSIARVIEEIKFYQAYSPDEYYLVHDFFTAKEQYVKDFCQALRDNNLSIEWNCRCRLNVPAETLKLMRDTGCTRLLYGVESGSKKILDVMNKRIRFDDVYSSIRKTIEAGIIPSLSFVVGLPEEDISDLNETLHLILMSELIGNCYPFMQIISPLPGTPVVENYAHYFRLYSSTAFSDGIEYNDGERLEQDAELIERHPLIFSSFYNIEPQIELGYLREIARAFVVVQQLFAYVYFAYIQRRRLTEIELYNMWRSWVLATKKVDLAKIDEVSDRQLWDFFSQFLAQDATVQSDPLLRNLAKYSAARHELITCDEDAKEVFVEFDITISAAIRDLRMHCEQVFYESVPEELLMRKNGYDVSIFKIRR